MKIIKLIKKLDNDNDYPIKKATKTITEINDPFAYPCCFVGKIISNISEKSILGTGVLISDNCVLTLAQIISQENKGTESIRRVLSSEDISFSPASQVDSNCFGEIKVSEIFFPPEYETDNDNFNSYNFAILKLKEPIGIKIKKLLETENKIFEPNIFSKSLVNLPLSIVGYQSDEVTQYRLYSAHDGIVKKIKENYIEYILKLQLPLEIGSPIFSVLQDCSYLVGMHIGYDLTKEVNNGFKLTISMSNLIQMKMAKFEDNNLQNYYELYGKLFILI